MPYLTVPQAIALDVTLPDPDLTYNDATKNWDFGEIEWSEFFEVIAGNGPCNRERVAARKAAHDEGAWVREAANAHAGKQNAKQTVAA